LSDSNIPGSHSPDDQPSGSDAIALTWQVRPVRRTDLEALTDLLAVSFHSRQGLNKWFYPMLKTALREDLRGRLQSTSNLYRCLVAVQVSSSAGGIPSSNSESLLGTVEISLKPQFYLPWYCWFKSFPYISNLAIAPTYRRRGIALDLLRSCEAIAQQWGYHDLYLHVLENNQAARALYTKTGFRVCQSEVNIPTLLLGQPQRLLLHKGLPASHTEGISRTGYLSQP